MCGIAGWVSFDRDLSTEQRSIDGMTRTMRCRGPDGSGTWTQRHVALGHHRLAVIDLAGGGQPMVAETPGGAVAITYSGEAYNFPELREELRRRGQRFRTASDTEVVLRGYLEWGDDVALKLNGMYAFAIWDARVSRLVMVRDRLGVKPLYYYPTADGVLFGSEPKAILAHPMSSAVLDLDGLRRMLAYVLTLPGVAWTGMHEVPPGGMVAVDRDGLRSRRYWSLPTQDHTDDQDTSVATVRSLLEDIVTRQLVADVPHGVLLSGGLDSSALTALAAPRLAEQGARVATFSVDFPGHTESFQPDDERAAADAPFVREMVAHVGTAHTEVVLDHAAVSDPGIRAKAVQAFDLPPGSGDRDRSLYLLFEAVRRHCTVALSGESADELFGGYSSFHEPLVQKTEMFPWVTTCLQTYGVASEALVAGLALRLDMATYFSDRYSDALAGVEHIDRADDHERRMRNLCHLFLTQELRVLLDRKDRLSMAVGLEVRVPYCDHRLVEYVYNAPWSLKSFDGREKSLLRAAVRDALPESVATRVKSAYPSIQDPRYVADLQREATVLAAERNDTAFDIVERKWLLGAAAVPPEAMAARTRNTLEWVLNLAVWLRQHRPALRLRG